MLDLYRNIKQKRLEHGWTQSDLASRMGYSDKSMISKIEAGKVDLARSKILEFADVLGCTASELMGEVEPQEDITAEARELYIAYMKASADVRSAVEILLKPHGSDS